MMMMVITTNNSMSVKRGSVDAVIGYRLRDRKGKNGKKEGGDGSSGGVGGEMS